MRIETEDIKQQTKKNIVIPCRKILPKIYMIIILMMFSEKYFHNLSIKLGYK